MYDVPRTEDNDSLTDTLYRQNLKDSSMPKHEFMKQIRVSHRTGRKTNKESVNIVFECPSITRRLLIDLNKIYLGYYSCNIRDYLVPTRCYKCQIWGNIAAKCTSRLTCSKCGKDGHNFEECPDKSTDKCANCIKDKKQRDHRVDSRECPAHERAINMEVSRIDHGVH